MVIRMSSSSPSNGRISQKRPDVISHPSWASLRPRTFADCLKEKLSRSFIKVLLFIILTKRAVSPWQLMDFLRSSQEAEEMQSPWDDEGKRVRLPSMENMMRDLDGLIETGADGQIRILSHSIRTNIISTLSGCLQTSEWKCKGHEIIALACLQEISRNLDAKALEGFDILNATPQPLIQSQDSFVHYAATFCFHHCQHSRPENHHVVREVHRLLQSIFCREKGHQHQICCDRSAADLGRALHFTAKYNFAVLSRTYLEMGADVNRRSSAFWETPLHVAVANCSLQTVNMLIERGAEVNAVDAFGLTPLHIVAICGCSDIAVALIEHGALLHDSSTSGLATLPELGDLSIPLLNKDAQPKYPKEITQVLQRIATVCSLPTNSKNIGQHTNPLFLGIALNNLKIVTLLVEGGVNMHDIPAVNGQTAYDVFQKLHSIPR